MNYMNWKIEITIAQGIFYYRHSRENREQFHYENEFVANFFAAGHATGVHRRDRRRRRHPRQYLHRCPRQGRRVIPRAQGHHFFATTSPSLENEVYLGSTSSSTNESVIFTIINTLWVSHIVRLPLHSTASHFKLHTAALLFCATAAAAHIA